MATRASGASRGADLLEGGARFAAPGFFMRLFAPGFHKVLDAIDRGLERGKLTGILPDGTTRVLGGRAPGFETTVTLHDWRALVRLATGGSVGWYQAWEAGEWTSEQMVELFALFMDNAATLGGTARAKGPGRWVAKAAHWFNRNTKAGSQKNIHAHYDLGNDFYLEWLDETVSYSSARWGVWRNPNPFQQRTDDLSYGQLGKIKCIQERLDIDRCERVLEIGCGWGGAAIVIASRGVNVDAISLSEEQLAYARRQVPVQCKGSVNFLKRDYRDVAGQYDAIYSIEMVEALGRENWPRFMDCIARNLKPGGKAAIQYISIRDELFDAYAESADFIQAYVFPGGMLIRTSEFRRLAEERGLRWCDQEDFGMDYAETLSSWLDRFDTAVTDGTLPARFDERFRNLWRYYLRYCEGGFRGGGIDVHQVTLVKE